MNYNKTVMVTGANGLIGKAICNYLFKKNVDVLAVYREEPVKMPDWKFIIWNIEDQNLPDNNIAPAYIVHCAASVPKFNTVEHFREVADKNKVIDNNILKFAVKTDSALIYTSGTSVYGFNRNEKVNENAILDSLDNPYFNQKTESEKLFSTKLNNVTILRISAPYEPCMNANTVIKLFINKALLNEDILYHGSGNRCQDFIHANDIADAVWKCIKKGENKAIYNIASAKPITMKKLAELIISKVPGCKSLILPSGSVDPQENYKAQFDISKAFRELNWMPKTELDAGVNEWIKYLQQ
ncbi:MAG: NAD(P)-dependent oxidoreductase [Ferruginibacter sp.]